MYRWSSPDRSFHHSFVKMRFDCEADPYPGVLILIDESYRMASAMSVKNLRKELLAILSPLADDAVAYWKIVRDDAERDKLLSHLTGTPIFDDIR